MSARPSTTAIVLAPAEPIGSRSAPISSATLTTISGARVRLTTMIGRSRVDRGDATVSLTNRSEEHTSELQSLMRISYAVFCLKKKKKQTRTQQKDDKK